VVAWFYLACGTNSLLYFLQIISVDAHTVFGVTHHWDGSASRSTTKRLEETSIIFLAICKIEKFPSCARQADLQKWNPAQLDERLYL